MIDKKDFSAGERQVGKEEKFLDLAIEHKMFSSRRNLTQHLAFMYGGHQLARKRVLDVGGGAGLLAFYAAANGADAICLEPEFHGSSAGMIERFSRFQALLPEDVGGSSIETVTFQDFKCDTQFDLIVLANSINHLDEPACERLHYDPASQANYRRYFEKMHELLRPGGSVIISDCDRINFFNQLGMKSPFMKTIEWRKHQSPRIWMELLKDTGFEPVSVQWSTPNSLGSWGRLLLGNRAAAYFLLSHFRLEARKTA